MNEHGQDRHICNALVQIFLFSFPALSSVAPRDFKRRQSSFLKARSLPALKL